MSLPLSFNASTLATKIFPNATSSSTGSLPFQINPALGLAVEVVILILFSGHALILTTLSLYKPWNIADLLLFSLSLADIINASIPLQMLNVVNNFLGPDLWTRASCAVFVILTYTLRMASVCTITLISSDRVILLTQPLQHNIIVTTGRSRKAVIAVWVFSSFVAILPFIGVGKTGFQDGFCFYQLFDLGATYGYIIESIGILQLLVVLGCFIAIKLSSVKFVKRQSTMAAAKQTGGKNQQARETAGTRQVKQLSTMMAIVVVLYYISWLPYLLINLYSMVTGRINHSLVVIIGLFSLVNALINPMLYGKMSQRYRKGYVYIGKKILTICGREKPNGSFFDGARRAAPPAVTFSSAAADKRSASASIIKNLNSSRENGGFQRRDETRSSLPSSGEARLQTTEDELVERRLPNVENNNTKLASINMGNVKSGAASDSENENLPKSSVVTAPLNECYDTAL